MRREQYVIRRGRHSADTQKETAVIERREPSTEEIIRQALQAGGEQEKEVEGCGGVEKEPSDESVVGPLTGAALYAKLRYAWPE